MRPKSPCAPDCPSRSMNCHSAQCPEWIEYEIKMADYRDEQNKERIINDSRKIKYNVGRFRNR